MAKHFPGAIWSFRWPLERKPNGIVRTTSKKEIGIRVEHNDQSSTSMILDRRTARLLAKRILDCLEKTK